MSNEEIVERIQAGETELMGELWAGVEKLVRWKAVRVSNATGGRCGVEYDDLYQCGYLAMVAAVGTYKLESGPFSNWLMFYLKTAFAEATGCRTAKDKMDPLNNSVSLDMPLGDETDSSSFGDIVPDPYAAATMGAIEEALWRKQLCEAMEDVLAELPNEQSTVLRCRYYEEKTLTAAAEKLETTAEEVRKLERIGLKELRHPRLAKRIRPFYDFDYYGGAGLGAFKSSSMSIQERYLIRMEQGEESEKRRQQDS